MIEISGEVVAVSDEMMINGRLFKDGTFIVIEEKQSQKNDSVVVMLRRQFVDIVIGLSLAAASTVILALLTILFLSLDLSDGIIKATASLSFLMSVITLTLVIILSRDRPS